MFNNIIEQPEKAIGDFHHCKCGELIHLKNSHCSKCAKLYKKDRRALLDYKNTSHRSLFSKVLSYTRKFYICGKLAEECQFNFRRYKGLKSKINTNTEKRQSEVLDPESAKISNLRRRRNLRRIINSNMSICKRPKFITLTFKEDVTVEQASHYFDVFMKRLKRRYGKIRYIWVKERTKQGRIHYHCIFFTDYFIPQKQLTALWGQGFTFVKLISNIQNVGAYMSKYITKDIQTEKNERFYSCSRGLLRPIIIVADYNDNFALSRFSCYETVSYSIDETRTAIVKLYRKC